MFTVYHSLTQQWESREGSTNSYEINILENSLFSILLWNVGEMYIKSTCEWIWSDVKHWLAWVDLSLYSVPPLRGRVHKGIVRNSPLNIAFLPPQHWSENQNQKHNTSAHTCIFFFYYALCLFLSVWLSLWFLSFPFLSVSCECNLWYTHRFLFVFFGGSLRWILFIPSSSYSS